MEVVKFMATTHFTRRVVLCLAWLAIGCRGPFPTLTIPNVTPSPVVVEPSPVPPVNAPPFLAHLIVGPSDPHAGELAAFTLLFPYAQPTDPITVDWAFGDGMTRTTQVEKTSYRYTRAGLYNVTVNVNDASGLNATAAMSIIVQSPVPAPPPPGSPLPPTLVASVKCSDNNKIASCVASAAFENKDVTSQLERIDWVWGDGLSDAPPATNPGQSHRSHTYALNGTYTVHVIAYWMGRTASASTEVTIP